MRTREDQIRVLAADFADPPESYQMMEVAELHILEAERRAEQRVRAEIGRDSERLDWIGTQDVVIGEYSIEGEWQEVLLARYQRTLPADLVDIRMNIDAAREAQ